jgi:NAD(P)-dependent dehydrogenase (short-subunit alcohol dehydrogenase family)
MGNEMDFKNKVVLITGASRGIGRACARAFADHRAHVAVNYHANRQAAEETLNILTGGPHELFCCDVSDPDRAQPLIQDVIKRFGRLDVLVNNAGIFTSQPILQTDYDQWLQDWQRILDTNLLGPANLMYWAARHMKQFGGGRIVNISSRGAFRGEPTAPAYGASKAALNSMSQSLAQALAPENIYVTVIAPGFVDTDMVAEHLSGSAADEIKRQSPLGRVARPEEIAHVVLFLASEKSDYLTGAIVDINGASYLRT